MAYIQRNVINGAYTNNNQWKQSLMTAVKEACATAGWTTVEDAYADGTNTRWVFRSPDNSFYAVFFYVTANATMANSSYASNIQFTICEGYDATAHTLTRPAVFTPSVAADAADNSVGSTSLSLATAFSSYGMGILGWNSSTTSITTYAVSVYADGIAITLDGSATASTIALGAFESLLPNSSTNDPVCLYAFASAAQSNTTAGITASGIVAVTRSALNGGKAAHNWQNQIYSWVQKELYNSGNLTNTSQWDLYQGGTGQVYSPVAFRRTTTTDISTYGSLRGRLKHIYIAGGTGALYDQITIGSTTYIQANTGNNYGSAAPFFFEKG